MIERKCETCEHKGFISFERNDQRATCADDCRHLPDLPCWLAHRGLLEARIAALEDVARKLAAEATKTINDVISKAIEARIEREAARAQVAARDEEIAALRARVEDWVAQYRALSARLESELGGLRHSLAEVEDERDEAVSAMAEWRARAEVAEPERDRLRDGLRWALEFIARCRWDEAGEIPPRDYDAIEGLRALLGEAKEGGAS